MGGRRLASPHPGPIPSASLPHPTDTRQVEIIVFLFLCCTWLEKEDFLEKLPRFLLFRPIKRRSFNLLCVLDLFFLERWQSTLFQNFFCVCGIFFLIFPRQVWSSACSYWKSVITTATLCKGIRCLAEKLGRCQRERAGMVSVAVSY